MILGILKEKSPERRVAMLPETVAALIKLKVTVVIEQGAGHAAFASDMAYEEVGATVVNRQVALTSPELILCINPPEDADIDQMKGGQSLMCVMNPYFRAELVKKLAAKKITSFSMDVIPRTSRAQAMDILSSMATVAGYKAVLTAANTLPKFFPMFMTAAGTITPAKVLILGAGVAGLQAVATSRKLGGVVEVFDVRAAVKEEVMGLGAKFVEVEGATDDKSAGGYAVEQSDEFKQRQAQAIHDHAVKSDVVICTAQIPGKKAPLLLRKETVEAMKAGSVIIDLAASTGGNCELTREDDGATGRQGDGARIVHNGVTIIGNSDFPMDMPTDASRMYGKNIFNFLKLIIDPEGKLHLNWADDIVKGTAVTHEGAVVHDRIKTHHNIITS